MNSYLKYKDMIILNWDGGNVFWTRFKLKWKFCHVSNWEDIWSLKFSIIFY